MRKIGGSVRAATGAMALAAALVPGVATAQTLPDFSIPGARPTSNPRSQGPVDADNPIVRAPVVRPTPTPAPSPVPVASPTPVPRAPATTVSAPPVSGTAPSRNPAPPPRTVPAASPQASESAAPGPAATDAVTLFPLPSGSSLPTITATDSVILPAAAERTSGSYWPWLAGGAALLAALLAGLWWRSRQPRTLLLDFVPPVVPAPAPVEPQPAPAARNPLPSPQLAAIPRGLGITLEAKRMSASLMATTLSYALTLTNNSHETLSALAVEGDMIAAHASLPPEQQIASDGQRLELRHALVTLAAGESAQFTGDFRLPLTAINPIRAGDAALFVPLARLRVEASTPAGKPLVQVQTYVVGETGDVPGAGLRPFRLDLGPRTYSRIGQRAVN